MSKLSLFFFITVLSVASYAENTQILKCRVANSEWTSLFILDAVGTGFLKFKKAGNNNSYTCGLKVDYINDGQRAVSPNITVEFMRGACDPELGPLDQEVFDRFTLIVDLTRKDKPEGRVQWLKRKQPDPCIVDKISMFDISMNAKKWIEGNWGRKTASDPKEIKKKK
jgi:hypothetical protein